MSSQRLSVEHWGALLEAAIEQSQEDALEDSDEIPIVTASVRERFLKEIDRAVVILGRDLPTGSLILDYGGGIRVEWWNRPDRVVVLQIDVGGAGKTSYVFADGKIHETNTLARHLTESQPTNHNSPP